MDLQAREIAYGADAAQAGDLYLPAAHQARDTAGAPVVCLLHGGFWRMPYGRDELVPVALDLQRRGYAVWNLEYRRVGAPGGGWPGTLQDVAAGIDHLALLAGQGVPLDLARVYVAGHSAGGHLALWSGRRTQEAAGVPAPARVMVAAAIGLAPVADLHGAHLLGSGRGSVANFLGATPEEDAARYRSASPMAMASGGAAQLVVHGTADQALPVSLSRNYVEVLREAGEAVDYIELDGGGHGDFTDPVSAAHLAWCAWLDRQRGRE